MTSPPRLAPLETMTEAVLASYETVYPPMKRLLRELEAQRLTRARERREVLEEAIFVVQSEHLHEAIACEGDQAYELAVTHCVANLEALRDREEA